MPRGCDRCQAAGSLRTGATTRRTHTGPSGSSNSGCGARALGSAAPSANATPAPAAASAARTVDSLDDRHGGYSRGTRLARRRHILGLDRDPLESKLNFNLDWYDGEIQY